MLISGMAPEDGVFNMYGNKFFYKKGEPLLTYSKGGHDNSFIQKNIPLSAYTPNSDGKTETYFFRYKKQK